MGDVINFSPEGGVMMVNTAKSQPRNYFLEDIVRKNVGFFYNKQWKQSEPRGQTVYNVSRGTVKPNLSTLKLVADRAKVPPWYLLLPLDEGLLCGPELAELVYLFIGLPQEDRQWVLDTIKRVK